MHFTLWYSETVFSSQNIATIGRKISQVASDWADVINIDGTASNVTIKFQEIPDGYSVVDGNIDIGVWLDCKMPAVLAHDRCYLDSFFASATNILVGSASAKITPDQIYVTAVHIVDRARTCKNDKRKKPAISSGPNVSRHPFYFL